MSDSLSNIDRITSRTIYFTTLFGSILWTAGLGEGRESLVLIIVMIMLMLQGELSFLRDKVIFSRNYASVINDLSKFIFFFKLV